MSIHSSSLKLQQQKIICKAPTSVTSVPAVIDHEKERPTRSLGTQGCVKYRNSKLLGRKTRNSLKITSVNKLTISVSGAQRLGYRLPSMEKGVVTLNLKGEFHHRISGTFVRIFHKSMQYIYIYIYIQGVTGGTDQTSGGCSLC